MIALGIDSSAVTCSVALLGDTLLAKRSVTGGPTHSTTLLPFVKEVLDEAALTLSEVDLVAVSSGPGSFTGLRIGISAVKGLCFSRDLPCASVSTLMALAMNTEGLDDIEGKVICPVMDARRGEYYNALFRFENKKLLRLTPDRPIAGEDLYKELTSLGSFMVLGDGAEKFSSQFDLSFDAVAHESIRYQDGESVAKIGLLMARENQLISCQSLSPGYLRLPQAEREWLEKNKEIIN